MESNSDVIDVDQDDNDDDDAATDREDACSTPELPDVEEEIELEKSLGASAVKSSPPSPPPLSTSRKSHMKVEEVDDTPKKERRRRSRSPAGRAHTRSAPKISEGPSEKSTKASSSQSKRGSKYFFSKIAGYIT